ncbi:MAG: helix-turn-helix domain-containing protein [Myxococcales bacterium]
MPTESYLYSVPPSDPTLPVTIDQAARLLGVSRNTVRRMVTGGMPHQKIGRLVKIYRADLFSFGMTSTKTAVS